MIRISRTSITGFSYGWIEAGIVDMRYSDYATTARQVHRISQQVDMRCAAARQHVGDITVQVDVTPWHVPPTPLTGFPDIIAIIG